MLLKIKEKKNMKNVENIEFGEFWTNKIVLI
jgi:hypothetical protein